MFRLHTTLCATLVLCVSVVIVTRQTITKRHRVHKIAARPAARSRTGLLNAAASRLVNGFTRYVSLQDKTNRYRSFIVERDRMRLKL